MSELHETSNPKHKEQIDTVGWVFAAVVIIITAIAATVAYRGNDNTVVANTTVSNLVRPHG